jgi:stalled ribosome alternative rescue factor ArfA
MVDTPLFYAKLKHNTGKGGVQMRNHVAKMLWTPKFRKQVVKSKKGYTRKIKHKGKIDG